MSAFFSATKFPVHIPESDWLRFGIILLLLLAVLQVIRLISRQNRYVLLFVVVVGGTCLMATWVYNRNEPQFLRPVVDIFAPWFPARSAV